MKPFTNLIRWATATAIVSLALPAEAVVFEPPGDLAPHETAGGASRESRQCLSGDSESLTLMVPHTNSGYTRSARPNFALYVPETEATELFFSIQDERKNQHYEAIVPLPPTPGITQIALPEDAPELEPGRTYSWYAVALCEDLDPSSPTASSIIERRADAADIPASTIDIDRVEALARSGDWYDTFDAMLQLRQAHPEDEAIAAEWQELLESVQLETIADKPIAAR